MNLTIGEGAVFLSLTLTVSDPPFEAFNLARTIQSYNSDVKVWVVQNKPQLNDDK